MAPSGRGHTVAMMREVGAPRSKRAEGWWVKDGPSRSCQQLALPTQSVPGPNACAGAGGGFPITRLRTSEQLTCNPVRNVLPALPPVGNASAATEDLPDNARSLSRTLRSQQLVNAVERTVPETDRAFQLIVTLQDVFVLLPMAEWFPGEPTS